MKLLAFSTSNSTQSINHALAGYASARARAVKPEIQSEMITLNEYPLPIYSIDIEKAQGIPQGAHDLLQKIGSADALIVAFAEHNGSVTAVWKNAFDWMSRIEMKLWQGKQLIALGTSPGSGGAAYVLAQQEQTAPYFGAKLLGSYGVKEWGKAWDASAQTLTREEDRIAIDALVSKLAA